MDLICYYILLVSTLGAFSMQGQTVLKPIDLLTEVFETTDQIQTLQYQMQKKELIDGEFVSQTSKIKLNRNPYQIYIYQLLPDKGVEVLYNEKKYGNKVLVNPNGFPWITLKLDPTGSIMLKDQHHTIFDGGFDLVMEVIKHLAKKYQGNFDTKAFLSKKLVTVNDRHCYQLNLINKDFHFKSYTVKDNESILEIASRNHLNGFMILDYNENVNNLDDVASGEEIMIPSDYAQRMELLIDKELKIPVSIKVIHNNRLFEHYQYSDIQIDPPLNGNDFSRTNSSYGF